MPRHTLGQARTEPQQTGGPLSSVPTGPGTLPRPGTSSYGLACRAEVPEPGRGEGQEAGPLRAPSQPLPLASLEFYSFPFLRFFSVCLFFIIFQDKEKESTQPMGILQEVRILFFLSCPEGGGSGPSLGTHCPGLGLVPYSVSRVPCCLGRPVFALDHVALFACARGRRLSGA